MTNEQCMQTPSKKTSSGNALLSTRRYGKLAWPWKVKGLGIMTVSITDCCQIDKKTPKRKANGGNIRKPTTLLLRFSAADGEIIADLRARNTLVLVWSVGTDGELLLQAAVIIIVWTSYLVLSAL